MQEQKRPTLSLKGISGPHPDQSSGTKETPTQNPQSGEASASSEFSPTSDLTDLMRAQFDASNDAGGEASDGATTSGGDGAYLSPDEWAAFFCLPFAASRVVIAARAGVDLQTLAITPKSPGVADASRAAFDLCKSVPWLEPITRRENSALGNSIIVVAFIGNVAQQAYAEFKDKTARPVAASIVGGEKVDQAA